MASDAGAKGRDPFVSVGDLHHRRFADDDRAGPRLVMAEPGDHVARAEAGGLLVVAQDDMDRALERGGLERRRHRQHAGVEPLHVAGAAAEEPPRLLAELERVARPGLAFDRHDVGMAREHHAAVHPGPDGREEGGLVARGVRRAPRGDAVGGEVVFDKVDHRQVGRFADALEGDEPRQEGLGRFEAFAAH